MKVSPRKAEIAAVVELLKEGDFESPEAGARAIIARVAELLGERSWWQAIEESTRMPYGPFATVGQALKHIDQLALAGRWRLRMIHSPAAALAALEKADALPPKWCSTCGHDLEVHGLLPKKKEACTIQGCACEAPTAA